MEKLSSQVVERKLADLRDWKLVDEKWIERKYRFTDYLAGIDFVQLVAHESEEANHHPFISIDYKLIRVKISSWKARGLTDLDFKLAHKYDTLYEQTVIRK